MTKFAKSLLPVVAAAFVGTAAMPTTVAGAQPMAGPTQNFNPMASKAVNVLGAAMERATRPLAGYTTERLDLNPQYKDAAMVALLTDPGSLDAKSKAPKFDSVFSKAVLKAVTESKAQVVNVKSPASRDAPSGKIEYGAKINPDGSALLVARDFFGNTETAQPMTVDVMAMHNARLQRHGLAKLDTRDNSAGYRTIFAARIAADGSVKLEANPNDPKVIAEFGLGNSRFDPLDKPAVRSTAPAARPGI